VVQQSIHTKDALLHVLVENKHKIKSFGVKDLNLFGSFAGNKEINDNSDIDLLVDFEEGKKTYDNFMDLNFFLEEITGRKVEILTRQ
jgi:predicted nucleotidyltransferase